MAQLVVRVWIIGDDLNELEQRRLSERTAGGVKGSEALDRLHKVWNRRACAADLSPQSFLVACQRFELQVT